MRRSVPRVFSPLYSSGPFFASPTKLFKHGSLAAVSSIAAAPRNLWFTRREHARDLRRFLLALFFSIKRWQWLAHIDKTNENKSLRITTGREKTSRSVAEQPAMHIQQSLPRRTWKDTTIEHCSQSPTRNESACKTMVWSDRISLFSQHSEWLRGIFCASELTPSTCAKQIKG